MGSFGMQELLIIVLILLLLFGAKKLPELFRAMGKGVNEFRKGMQESEPAAPKPTNGGGAEVSENQTASRNSE